MQLDIDLYPPIGGSAIVYDATLNEPLHHILLQTNKFS